MEKLVISSSQNKSPNFWKPWKVTSQPRYANAYVAFNILEIWNMTEQVCVGRGAISVHTLIIKLFRTTHREGYQRFANEFKDTVADPDLRWKPF
jgi:hypothetical protein